MPTQNTLAICQEHLFSDVDKMQAAGVPQTIQERIVRIRDVYNIWLQNPARRTRELVVMEQDKYNIHKSEAYDDIKIVRLLLGDLNESSKEFHRWRFNEMILRAIELAEKKDDVRSLVAALDKYAKYNKLDQEDEQDKPFEVIAVQPFEPTENPEVIGIKRVPNINEKIRKKIQQYWNEDIEDVTLEAADFDEEKTFQQ
jgi:hypothetical protein